MKTIYLDHNIVHYYALGFPPNVDEANERHALAKIRSRHDEIRIVFSTWNLIEASRNKPWGKAHQLAQFLQDQEPYWIHERRVLQRAELQSYIYSRFFNEKPDGICINAITPSFSQIMCELTPSLPVLLNERPEHYIRYLFDHLEDQNRILDKEKQTPDVLKTLQQAKAKGHLTDELEAQWTKQWISLSMPDRQPDGKPVKQTQGKEILAYCLEHYENILRKCPCLQSEHLLADYRIEDVTRNPQRQDAIDLMHMAPALAYCDAVVTNDGYLCGQGRRYAKDAGRPVIVNRLLSQTVEEIL